MSIHRRLLLLGYSGKRNFGDDLLLKQAYDCFQGIAEIHIHTTNINQNSDYLYTWFPKAYIFKSRRLKHKYLKNFTHILQFGGGVFFDYNKINFKDYWRKRISITKNFQLVRRGGTHFAGIGIGLGPFIDKKGENLCFRRLKNFDYLNVRDDNSFELCKNHKHHRVTLSEDLTLANYQYYNSFKIPIKSRTQRIIICPRKFPHGNNKNKYLENLFLACRELEKKNAEIFVYGFQSNHDEEIIAEFSKKDYKTEIWNPDKMIIEDVLKEFANAKMVITTRMHGLYIAGILDVPVIGIGVHQKLILASKLFSGSVCLPDNFDVCEMMKIIKNTNELPENISRMLSEMEVKCKEQYDFIKTWIYQNNN